MIKTRYLVLAACLAVFHVNHSFAQRNEDAVKYANTIAEADLKKHLQILASDEYEGRETGKPGQKKAAEYISKYYETLGVKPVVNGSWFQTYPLKIESNLGSFAMVNGQRYDYVKDFYLFGSEWTALESNDIVFVGYGIDDERYSDYKKKVDLKDKVALCIMGEPMETDGKSKITGDYNLSAWSQEWDKKTKAAAERGAKGIIFVNMYYDMYISRIRYWLEVPSMTLDYGKKKEDTEGSPIPEVFVSPRMANGMLSGCKKDVESLQKKISKSMKSKPFALKKATAKFHVEQKKESLEAENVLCFIEGSDPALKNEVVVISAHYDHIGIVGGQINNGADDDGSGTVSTMEIAEAFVQAKKDGKGPRRSILILNVSGEEKGLLGSEWYAANPVFPLENTVCNLNIDMIGREDKKHAGQNYVYIIGSDKLSTELHTISEESNKTYSNMILDYTYNDPKDPNRFYYRSDHYNFAKHNIPVIFYFSGVHEDYHKPTDDEDKILYEKMANTAKLIFHTAWEVANRDARLVVDVENDFENN
jgi:hypothetical protein